MASIDKVAIGFTIAIVAIGIAFAFYGDAVQNAGSNTAPAPRPVVDTAAPEIAQDTTAADDAMMDDDAMMGSTTDDAMMDDDAMMGSTADDSTDDAMMDDDAMMGSTADDSTDDAMMDDATSAGPQTYTVIMPEGTSVPGCEVTNECYIPADVTISAGDTVEWVNADTAAHTVTGGNLTDGPSGVFDSSLIMVDAIYAYTFDDAGSYDYFCLVHPWMVGSVTVN